MKHFNYLHAKPLVCDCADTVCSSTWSSVISMRPAEWAMASSNWTLCCALEKSYRAEVRPSLQVVSFADKRSAASRQGRLLSPLLSMSLERSLGDYTACIYVNQDAKRTHQNYTSYPT